MNRMISAVGCLVFGAVAIVSGCGNADKPEPVPMSITIEPADLSVTVINDQAETRAYTVTEIYSDGSTVDVTDYAKLSIRDVQVGSFDKASLTITGQGAGPTRLYASVENLVGETGLVVFVKKSIIDADVPPTTPDLFDGATEDAALAPVIQYPLNQVLVPPNLGQFDVHWSLEPAQTSDVFRMRMQNTYIDIRRYTRGLTEAATPFWAAFAPSEWYPIASTKEQLTLEVAGMNSADPTKKGTAAAQLVDVTNENTRGGIYYWTTTNPASILRYDVEQPGTAPTPLFETAQEPGGAGTCHGCHTLSKDGTRLAMVLDGGNGRGTAIDVATRALTIPVSPATRWNFATFTPDAKQLLTVYGGVISVRDSDTGMVLGTLANTPGKLATHPELSPDGTKLASVECTGGYEAEASGCSLVVRAFDVAANSAGAIQELVAAGADGLQSYYPSFSPDGKWIAFTRGASAATTYNAASAASWVIRADGGAAPLKLTAADLGQDGRTNSWARWVPFGQTFGAGNEPMFYLTFSSARPYGVRLPAGGRPQIWMTPFFPARAEAGKDPTGPAFRLPFQDVANGNHIAQWTQAIVNEE